MVKSSCIEERWESIWKISNYAFVELFICPLGLPFLGLTGVILAFRTSKRSTIRGEKVEDKKPEVPKKSTATINRNRSAYLRNATSRRQRFKEKSETSRTDTPTKSPVVRTDLSVEFDYLKSLIEVKETQSLDSGNNASALSTSVYKGIEVSSTSVDKSIEVSSTKEPISGLELPLKSDLVLCDRSSSQTNKSDSSGDEQKNKSSEDPEDEDEEEAQEDRNKAVEWTEDDQKNLMDLGLSEIERNRRLESLIAKRRARKLYKRKNEEIVLTVDILPPCHIPKIVTTRNDPLDSTDGGREIEGIPLPGSAPSVLLPMRNPFDLPYDPHEEKPNLMADSFQQEFTFCRHESFCLGPAYSEESGGLGYHHRYRRPSISIADKGEHDWLIEQLLFKSDPQTEKKKPIAVEARGIQTEDLPQARDVNELELESGQEKEIPPDSQSEFEIELELELTQDVSSQSSHSSSSDNPGEVICDDVRVVSKNFESKLSNALHKSLSCRVPKKKLIKEPLCDFSPTTFNKNKMEERLPYPDKVPCQTPTYSIASDLQVEVSEIGSPPTVDGNNTDGESLNPDWEVEKEASFGGKQDNTSPLLELRSNKIVLDSQEEEVKAMNVTEALPPKTILSPMAEELVDQPSQVVSQMPEELFIPTDDEKATNHIIDQKDPEALANMENTVKTRENVDGGLEILMKQEDDGKITSSLEETDLKLDEYFHGGPEDSSGRRSDLDHEQSEEGNKNVDQITGNGDLGRAHEHSEEGSKNVDQITGNGDLSRDHERSEEGSKNMDQITGNGDLSRDHERSEEGSKNMDQSTGNGDLGRTHEHSEEGSKHMDQITSTRDLGKAHEHLEEDSKITDQITDNVDLVEPGNIEEQLELIQDNKNQSNVVGTEFQSSKDALKFPVVDEPATNGGVPLVANEIICSDTSDNQVNSVQSESHRNNGDFVEPKKIEEPLELKQDIKNQPDVVKIEFQSSNDASKSTVENNLVYNGGVPPDSIDIIRSDALQNQVNVVQSELQKSNDAMKSTVEQDSVIERELLDTRAGLSSKSSIEEQVHMNKVSLSQDSITSPDNNKPADSIEVESELINGFSEQNGGKSILEAKDDREKTDQNLSSLSSAPNDDLKISEITIQEEVAVNPLTEITAKEVQVETEQTPTASTNHNMEAAGDDKLECESHRFNKPETDAVKEKDSEFGNDMESYSKDLNGVGQQSPTGLAHENPLESSLSAGQGSQ
ncbi:uncharacterized protein LOC111493143 isoform X2 [Cucurbita maxima]|uniref:Uncharacterized protein LOC111493143 isoform X2 n=1 Tax=Cucurbita maxima TaxID=3661 RepID=A0A6J1KH15_CUCMA|nr:uncharacterized protein LOC111493143 isoform X2 [Cucurbita maxima]